MDLGPDVTFCEGGSVTLDATLPGASYLWNDGFTGAVRTVTSAGTWSVVATVGPCTVSDIIQVNVTPLPLVDLGPDVALCPGETASFNATTTGGNYVWHDGSTQPTYQTTSAGAVTVTVTVNGCSASDEAFVSVLNAPQAELGSDTTLCEGASLVLDVTQNAATYLWDDGSTGGTRTVTDAGLYWVLVETNGCTDSDSVLVSVFSPSSVELVFFGM